MTPRYGASLFALAALGLAACQPAEPEAPPETSAEAPAEATVIEVMLEDFSFLAPPQLRSGWTTFRMTNTGAETHFMLLWRLPEGTTFGDYTEQLAHPFQELYDRYTSDELSQGEMLEQLGAMLPEWFGSMEGMGRRPCYSSRATTPWSATRWTRTVSSTARSECCGR